ncbi:alanine and arginine-rich domain-containing protein-like [Myxocyprinus asiaticus]|uniref:alanine and arginine-rich domain-containing protein-like n=1 Tax=Myxocyprinus asiaticus TaxID=70543 RepID=UPI0022225E02|nr:alanine and arginine-rich domain-containing protein-like [Myxocyprinus asiaticus]
MNSDTQYEDTVSIMVLENIKYKLLHAFRTSGESRTSAETATCPINVGKSVQVNEELRRAKIDGALTWLRSELLEMRFQDRQLAQTLLGLNREIQRLRQENGSLLLEPDNSDHLETCTRHLSVTNKRTHRQ